MVTNITQTDRQIGRLPPTHILPPTRINYSLDRERVTIDCLVRDILKPRV